MRIKNACPSCIKVGTIKKIKIGRFHQGLSWNKLTTLRQRKLGVIHRLNTLLLINYLLKL